MVDFSAIAVGRVGLTRSGFKQHHNPAMYFNMSLDVFLFGLLHKSVNFVAFSTEEQLAYKHVNDTTRNLFIYYTLLHTHIHGISICYHHHK